MRLRKIRTSLLLSTFMCSTVLFLAGCNVTKVVDNEVRKEHKLEDMDYILRTNTSNQVTKIDEMELLKNMELTIENEFLALYIGDYYDIAVYDKTTKKVHFSNPALRDSSVDEKKTLIDEAKKLLYSQVSLEYYNSNQKKLTMTSYPDSFSENKNQVSYEVKDDSLIVSYGIGTNYSDTGLIQAFTKDTYGIYDERLQGLVKEKAISVIDYRAFVNNYTETTYSKLPDGEKEEYKLKYPNIETLDTIYTLKPKMTNKLTNQLVEMYSLLEIDDQVRQEEEDKMGVVESTDLPAFFKVPVKYQLQGNDFIVTVDTDEIVTTEGYYLSKVELLKSFSGAQNEEEGYLFIPDGSGSIIEHGTKNRSMDKVSIPFYGQDYGINYASQQELNIDSSMPVFGIKKDNTGIFAIVESGAAIGGVTAQITTNYMNYNIVYPYFHYNIVDKFDREGVAYAFYNVAAKVPFTVRYHFLEGEESSYSGMANYYKNYLIQNNMLKKVGGSSNELPMDIQFLGSITKLVNRFGIPIETPYPMTTFEDGYSISSQLKEADIHHVDVIYSGMLNGGSNFKAVDKVKVQKELGGVNGFKELNKKLHEMSYGLYTDVDFTRIYEEGHGIKAKEDVSKYLNRNTAYMADMNPALNSRFGEIRSYIVNPSRYLTLGSSFLKAYKNLENEQIYLSSIGTYLSGNYSMNEGITRQTSYIKTLELLELIVEEGYELKLDYGNDYVLEFAESLSNVATTSSHQKIESYSIPFVGMVLKGNISYTSKAINQANNSDRAILEAIESGAGLNYLLIEEEQLSLVDTNQMNLFSVHYKLWMDDIISTYKKLNYDLGYLADVEIVKHEKVTEWIRVISYENGAKVYVNYDNKDYNTADGTVSGMSYLLVK